MKRRDSICALLFLGSTPLASFGQHPARLFRIGYLQGGSAPVGAGLLEALRAGLRDLGYVEGKHFVFEFRWADGKIERLPSLAIDLVQREVDVLVTAGTPATEALKQATTSIPIVMATSGDPVGSGLVASLARPGGNVTGQSILAPELTGKRLELIKEIEPTLSDVSILSSQANPHRLLEFQWAQSASHTLGIRLRLNAVQDVSEIQSSLAGIGRGRTQALVVLSDPLFSNHQAEIVEFATKNRVSLVADQAAYVESGGFLSYNASWADLYRRAASYVDRILKGARPADLPVEQPTKFEFVVNQKTAKMLGLKSPQTVLIRADRVIE